MDIPWEAINSAVLVATGTAADYTRRQVRRLESLKKDLSTVKGHQQVDKNRMDRFEAELASTRSEAKSDHDLLIRVDERTGALKAGQEELHEKFDDVRGDVTELLTLARRANGS